MAVSPRTRGGARMVPRHFSFPYLRTIHQKICFLYFTMRRGEPDFIVWKRGTQATLMHQDLDLEEPRVQLLHKDMYVEEEKQAPRRS